MVLTCAAICGPGLIRPNNQDNLYANGAFRKDVLDNSVFRHRDSAPDTGLYAVADGMGGERHGELAALIAVQGLEAAGILAGSQSMPQYLARQNAAVCDLIREMGVGRIGSTFAGLRIQGSTAEIANIGDSRIYRLRGGALAQISHDHTTVRQMVDLGVLSAEQARTHPARHKLTQHLGVFPGEMVIEPYTATLELEAGDVFLLCSDGLTDMLDDAAIEAALCAPGSVADKAEGLFEQATARGGRDNLSVLLVQVTQETQRAARVTGVSSRGTRVAKRHSTALRVLCAMAVLAVLMLALLGRDAPENTPAQPVPVDTAMAASHPV